MSFQERREDFPTLNAEDAPIYFDNACMTLKPYKVIDAINQYYSEHPSCGGRSVHRYANEVAKKVIQSRRKMANFIGCNDSKEVVFTRNATHSLNQIAKGLTWSKGDIVLTSDREHNSNLAPWLQLEQEVGVGTRKGRKNGAVGRMERRQLERTRRPARRDGAAARAAGREDAQRVS